MNILFCDKNNVLHVANGNFQEPLPLATAIKAYREREGLTQPEFAKLFGRNSRTISLWENGTYPPVSILCKLLQLL